MRPTRPVLDGPTQLVVRVLGAVEVTGARGPAPLVGARQRAVAGLLALHAGAAVPTWRLVDALWGDDPPRTATRSLHSHVARVRQALDACGLPDTLVTTETGYALMVDRALVDALVFEEYARQGRDALAEGAYEEAARLLGTGVALWRQETALAATGPAGWAVAEVERLAEARLTAIEDLWDAQLHLGRHAAAPVELERLLVAHPVRERLVGLLMLALYRCGRHSAALDAYRRLRARLAEQLGTDPAPELAQLHTRILRRDPELSLDPAQPSGAAPPSGALPRGEAPRAERASTPEPPPMPRPAQLPAPVGHFTGRFGELALLDQLLASELLTGGRRDTRVVAISGAAGIGKTALAVHWAHLVADRFPDGQLFVDLRGHDAQRAASPEDTLSYLLRSLGIPAERIPSGTDERGSLYRSLLHDRRVLVVLDNGGPVDDILPLVPAGAGNLLVVTSRQPLHSLVAHHAVRLIRLAALTGGEAQALLRGLLSADQVAGDPAAVAELSEVCDRLPLALRIAAAKLAGEPNRTARQLVAELSGADRLDRFTVDGDSRSVRAVFASAYSSLSTPAARLFRQLGLVPAATVHTQLAAALAGTSPDGARRALNELLGAHLITEVAADRYGCHDLVRLFARQLATVDDPEQSRAETLTRLLDWYLAVAYAANRLIDPGRDRVTPVLGYPPGGLPFPDDRVAALAFLDTERENLPLVIRHAAEYGPRRVAAQLTYLLTGFYDVRGHWTERVQICGWAVRAAGHDDDPGMQGLMRSALGVAYIMTRQFDRALEELHVALPLMRAVGDLRGEGHVYNNIAAAHSGLRRFDEAVEAFGQALAVHSSNGYRLGVALALNNTGHTYVRMGEAGRGAPELVRALHISRQIGNRWLEAAVLHSLGEARLGQGDADGAVAYFGQAHEAYRQLGDQRHEAEMATGLGLALLRQGRMGAALERFGAALDLTREIGDQHLEAVALCQLGRAHLDSGDLAAARYDLLAALALRRLTPDRYEEAQVHRLLGEVEERRGDPEGVQRHWRTAIELLRKENATAEADALAGLLVDPPAGVPASGAAATSAGRRPG